MAGRTDPRDKVPHSAADEAAESETREGVLARHMKGIVTAIRICDRLLASTRHAVRVSDQVTAGTIRLPDGPVGQQLRKSIAYAASPRGQREALRSIAESMVMLSEMALTNLATARDSAAATNADPPARARRVGR